MGLVNLILIVTGIVVAYYVFKLILPVKRAKEVRMAIATIPDFTCTYSHVGDGGYDGIAVDEAKGTIYFLSRALGRLASYRVSASHIMSAEIFEDAVTQTVQSGGGVVVMLGRIGVPLGGPRLTTRHAIARLELRTVVNDPAVPAHFVTFIGSPCKRGGIAHRFFGELAQQWQARIRVLATRAQQSETTSRYWGASVDFRRIVSRDP